ncbi:MAG: beta-lactamase family protein [Calditrichaeota bacterium]|nr:beta-lactamase family protein [Calditrichota bacterium]
MNSIFISAFLLISLTNCASQSIQKDYSWLDNYINEFNRLRGFSGTVLIAKGDQIVFQKATGWSHLSPMRKNTLNTKFRLGSGNKMFTAIAIAQLAEQDKLKFNDPIINYLPDYPNRKFAREATIHQLLTHSSGMGDYWDDDYETHWDNIRTLEEILPFFATDSIQFKPGEKHQYSNAGFIVLGLIIEKVTGQSYFDYIRSHIYEPVNMTNSDSYEYDANNPELAIAYAGHSDKWYAARHGIKGSSAGGGYSTVGDIFKFSQALKTNRLISEKTRELVQTDKTPANHTQKWGYAYGFIVGKKNNKRFAGHGGTAPGTYFNYNYFPELDITVIIMSNSESGLPDILFERLCDFVSNNEQRPSFLDQTKISDNNSDFNVHLIDKPETTEPQVVDESTRSELDYWTIVDHLIKAINTKQIESYYQQFSKQDLATRSKNESMFQFMIDGVIPRRGQIAHFHELSKPLKIADSEFPVRVATFHLADGLPGQMSFSLDESGKIDHFSLFVHPQICSNGQTKTCPKNKANPFFK